MTELYPYQKDGVEFLRKNKRAFLADDPGLGKSAQLIYASEGATLIVAPAMLKGTWQDELEKWADNPERFTWTSYHQLHKQKQRWDTVIFDESHYLKNHKAKWTGTAQKLKTDHTFLATGTPVPNWAHELFTTIKMLHQDNADQTRWRSRWRWIETWFQTWQPPWGGVQIQGLRPGLTWEQFYAGNDLNQLMLRRKRDDVLKDLPPLTEQYISTPMVSAQRKLYNELKEEYLAWVEETGEEVAAFSSGGLHIKLAKIQTGICTIDPSVSKLHSNKLEVLRELLEERAGNPTLVVAHFRNTAASIGGMLDSMGLRWKAIVGGASQVSRDRSRDEFQSGQLDVLVGTLDSISEGLTLTRADCCIFVERSWKPYKNEQAMRRIHRIGQTRPVSIIYLVTENALDAKISKLLKAKLDQQALVLSAGQLRGML